MIKNYLILLVLSVSIYADKLWDGIDSISYDFYVDDYYYIEWDGIKTGTYCIWYHSPKLSDGYWQLTVSETSTSDETIIYEGIDSTYSFASGSINDYLWDLSSYYFNLKIIRNDSIVASTGPIEYAFQAPVPIKQYCNINPSYMFYKNRKLHFQDNRLKVIEVLLLNGKIIKTLNLKSRVIDLSDLPSGSYMVKAHSKDYSSFINILVR